MTQGVEFYFSSPHDTVEVLGKYFNDQHVNTFFSNLDVLLLRCIEGIVEGIVQAEDEQQMIEKIDILYQLCENDHNLAALVKRSKQGLLERLARRIMSPQNGATSVKCSINAIWLLRQICPEWLPEVQGVTHPDLLEQLLLAHANRLHYYRDVEPYESIDFALSVLQLRNHTSEDMRNKLNLASLTLLNRCIVECLRPSRFAVDYLINKGAVPLVVEAAKSSSSSTKNEDQKWAEEKVIQQAAELAIGLASVDGGRERLLGCKFHETLMQSIMNVTADESKKWLIYCVATIGGPGVILECVQRVTSVANVEVSINYMRLSFQVLSSFIGDRMNEDLHSGEDGTKHFQHIISSLSFYLQTANQDSEDAHMLELLPELMRAIRSSVNKMNYLPQNEESYQVQRECLAVVFETVKKQSKNDGVVQTAVEVMGTILEHTTITSEVQQAIMIQLREAHRHHLSSKHTQHWILWTVLVLTDLPTMLTFMKEHKSSPAVQEGAICSLGDYFGQENDRGAIVDMGPISEAVHFVSQAMQRYPHLRSSGVRTLGALSGLYSVDHLPVKEPRSWRQEKPIYDGDMQAEKDAITDGLKLSTIVEQVMKVLRGTDKDSVEARTACITALRVVLEGLPASQSVALPVECLETITKHLAASLPAKDQPELFVDGLWLLGLCGGPDEICKLLARNQNRVGLFKCGFRALSDLYIGRPMLLQREDNVQNMVDFAMKKWPHVQDTVEAAEIIRGFLAAKPLSR